MCKSNSKFILEVSLILFVAVGFAALAYKVNAPDLVSTAQVRLQK